MSGRKIREENIKKKITWCFTPASSFQADDLNNESISSRETLAVSGTIYVDQRYANPDAVANMINVPLLFVLIYSDFFYRERERERGADDAEKSNNTGVKSPMRTIDLKCKYFFF